MSRAPAPPKRWLDWRILPLLAVTLLILWLLVDRLAGADAFFAVLAGARWPLVGLAVALVVANYVLAGVRWRLVLRAMGHSPGLGRCLAAVIATWPLALVIPARAGDVLRALAVREEVPTFEGVGSVIAEKAIDVQSLCVLAIVGTAVHGFWQWTPLPVAVLLSEWAVVWILLRRRDAITRLPVLRRVSGKLTQLIAALQGLVRSPGYAAGVIGTSLVAWTLSAGIVQALLQATDAGVDFGATLSLWPIAVFAGMLPLTVAGMGTRDAAFVYALQTVASSAAREEAVLASTIGYSIVATWLLALVGLPFGVRFALTLGRQQRAGDSDG